MINEKRLIVEHTMQKPVPGTVHSVPIVTRTTVAIFTRRTYETHENTYCMRCSLDYALKTDSWGLARHQENCIRPDSKLDELFCVKCGKYVFPMQWINIDEQLPVRGEELRYIICRYRDRYPTEEYREWRSFYLQELWPQEKCDEHRSYVGDNELKCIYDAWCEV